MKFTPVILWLALALLPARAADPVTPPASTAGSFRLLAEILASLEQHYADPAALDATARTTEAYRDFLHRVDPTIDLITEDESATADRALGLTLAIRDGKVVIVAARDAKLGLLAGDELVGIRPTLHDARTALHTNPTIRVRDPFAIRHREVKLAPVPLTADTNTSVRLLNRTTGYYRLAEINAATVTALAHHLARFQRPAPAPVVLDLRGNPGGALDAALDMARLFLPAQATIVTLDAADPGRRVVFQTDKPGPLAGKVALRLLINGGTAAEAEIVAAALRDNGAARLVGTRTFGAGRLFARVPLSSPYVLWLPTSRYRTPAGATFDAVGLTPDVEVSLTRSAERDLMAEGSAQGLPGFDPYVRAGIDDFLKK